MIYFRKQKYLKVHFMIHILFVLFCFILYCSLYIYYERVECRQMLIATDVMVTCDRARLWFLLINERAPHRQS